MQFGLSEEQTLLQSSVDRYLDNACSLERVREFVNQPQTSVWDGLSELGVPALLIPESAGGLGMTGMDAALVAESLGAHTAPTPFIGSAIMAPIALRLSGKDPDNLLAALATGEKTVGIAMGEAIATRADAGITSQGDTLQGKALYVFDYGADYYLVADSARSLFLVDAQTSDLHCERLSTIDKTRQTGLLEFNNTTAVRLSDDVEIFQRVIDAGRVMLAADTLGAAQIMLDQAVEYAMQREQFNRPIGSFQAVKHMCAEMAASLEPCRAMVWYAAHALDELPGESTLYACHTKAHLAEVGTFVAKTATEVHGGMGFTDLLGLHYWFKRIGFNRQLLGAPELIREEAARVQQLVA